MLNIQTFLQINFRLLLSCVMHMSYICNHVNIIIIGLLADGAPTQINSGVQFAFRHLCV